MNNDGIRVFEMEGLFFLCDDGSEICYSTDRGDSWISSNKAHRWRVEEFVFHEAQDVTKEYLIKREIADLIK